MQRGGGGLGAAVPHAAVPHLRQGGHQHLQRLPAPGGELRQPGQVRCHHYEPPAAPNEVSNTLHVLLRSLHVHLVLS